MLLFLIDAIYLLIFTDSFFAFFEIFSNASFFRYPNSKAISVWQTISIKELYDTLIKCIFSWQPFLLVPSAILEATETAALFICCTRAYFSSHYNCIFSTVFISLLSFILKVFDRICKHISMELP